MPRPNYFCCVLKLRTAFRFFLCVARESTPLFLTFCWMCGPTVSLSIVSGNLASGVEEVWSDDDLDIEDDDEFRRRKLLHDKKKRQAEKV